MFEHLDPRRDRPNDFAWGWYADVAVNLSPKFALVGEAGGSYLADDLERALGSVTITESLDVRFHTFMGGVRVRAPQNRRIVPFGQVLVGGEHDTSAYERTFRYTFMPTASTTSRKGSFSNAVLAPDGGVTRTAGAVGVRTSVGYARFFSNADADALRVSVGAALRF